MCAMAAGAGEDARFGPTSSGGGTEDIPPPGPAGSSWPSKGRDLVSCGISTRPSLMVAVIPRIAPQASTKQAATAALAEWVLAGAGRSVARRWLAVTAVRRWRSAPIHAIKALAGGPEPAFRRWRGISPCTLTLRVRQPHLTYLDTPLRLRSGSAVLSTR